MTNLKEKKAILLLPVVTPTPPPRHPPHPSMAFFPCSYCCLPPGSPPVAAGAFPWPAFEGGRGGWVAVAGTPWMEFDSSCALIDPTHPHDTGNEDAASRSNSSSSSSSSIVGTLNHGTSFPGVGRSARISWWDDEEGGCKKSSGKPTPPPPIPMTHTSITQPLRLEIKKKLTARSDRIKSVDLHPTEVRAQRGRGGMACWPWRGRSASSVVHSTHPPTFLFPPTHTQPWVLSALYTGNVFIWDYSSGVRRRSKPTLHPPQPIPPNPTSNSPTEPHIQHTHPPAFFLQAMVKSFEVCDLPVRCAKFIVRKSWFVAASDDMFLRVYNYNTMEKVKAWEAHMVGSRSPHPPTHLFPPYVSG